MTSLIILNLMLFILIILMTNVQAKLIDQKTEINGENLSLITCLLDIYLRIYF